MQVHSRFYSEFQLRFSRSHEHFTKSLRTCHARLRQGERPIKLIGG